MRAAKVCIAMLVTVAGPSWAGEQTARVVSLVEASDMQSLQDSLLDLAQERLRSTGLLVDRQHARTSLSGSLPSAHIYMYEVRPTWRAGGDAPKLPLTFDLQPKSWPEVSAVLGRASNARPVQATLAVPLLREVWVAGRRLRKGSAVKCADLSMQRRDIRNVPRLSLAPTCQIEPDAVALRDIAAGDVMRSVDVGKALDVTAGAPVRLTVTAGRISVATTAIALADARVGDQIDVRLQRPTRTLRASVTAPGSVRLIDGSP